MVQLFYKNRYTFILSFRFFFSSFWIGLTNNNKANRQDTNSAPLHPSWEASKQARAQCYIQKSQAKKIIFNNSDDENS